MDSKETIKLLKAFKPGVKFSGKVEDWPFFKLEFTAPLRTAGALHLLQTVAKDPDADYCTAASAIFGYLVSAMPKSIIKLVLALPPWTKAPASKDQVQALSSGSSFASFIQELEANY